MRLPIRRSQRLKIDTEADEPLYLTKEGIEKLQRKLERLEKQELPQAISDVQWTGQFGDFSENAEYQEAKGRMRRLHDQIAHLKERLKRIVIIQKSGAQSVQLGSTVELEMQDGKSKTFEIVGPQETDPLRGRLSFKSPLGARLINRKVGEEINIETNLGTISYKITQIS